MIVTCMNKNIITVHDGSWGYHMDSRRFMMTYDNSWQFLTAHDDSWQFKIIHEIHENLF